MQTEVSLISHSPALHCSSQEETSHISGRGTKKLAVKQTNHVTAK